MSNIDNKTVLLFFKEHERDSFVRHDRYLKRIVRPVVGLVRRRQTASGFATACAYLAIALRREGYKVEINNERLARRHPEHPVGLIGYPSLLENWELPNPALLGPGMYDHPMLRPALLNDERFRLYIVTSSWVQDMFRPVYGSRCVVWHNGIDTDAWPDLRGHPKTVDVLVYDKIHWRRPEYERTLIQPILELLRARGLTYQVVRYGRYSHRSYRGMLRRSRSMLFLGEHETQGLAYQEAMATNVAILAWDNGFWLDPRRPALDPDPVPACSVPYFSNECGERFRAFSDFPAALDRFLDGLPSYEPRRYVERELSLAGSARLYLQYYWSVVALEQAGTARIDASPSGEPARSTPRSPAVVRPR
ncbi:MAG: glycosyltransferase [Chloroflexi bacterium]|nr:glycosyltransferase [Chloroflexota bacterium]